MSAIDLDVRIVFSRFPDALTPGMPPVALEPDPNPGRRTLLMWRLPAPPAEALAPEVVS